MENKKNVKQNFLQKDLQTSTLEEKKKKKERKKKKRKKGEEPNLLLIFMSPITQIFSTFVPDREINYNIIIRSNISSNGKNQYY